jgi:carboxymethylenebutenolidase
MKMVAVNFHKIVINITLTSYISPCSTKDSRFRALWNNYLQSIFIFALIGTENAMTEKPAFAPAAGPQAATVVTTPEQAISAGETSIPTQGDNMPAYHARPKESEGPLPIVIVVQEIFGVHEHIRDLCRRLALEGYLAVAP